jgi:hexosaminidase
MLIHAIKNIVLLPAVKMRHLFRKNRKLLDGFVVIPEPEHVSIFDGEYVLEELSIASSVFDVWPGLVAVIESITKRKNITIVPSENPTIHIQKSISLPESGYSIQSKNGKITIEYHDYSGLIYALYTLIECIQKNDTTYIVRNITIQDSPKYEWRGLHFDVARHYFPISFLYELVEDISFLKLSVLHLHLTDDQGWRFESKKYPLLHEIGSKRRETVVGKYFPFFGFKYVGDKQEYSGYYTQGELRNLALYADSLGVTIVPEIDIPGHATAALTAYPEYAAYTPPNGVVTFWGVFDNVFSPSEGSIHFLCGIFDEVMDVFPSRYIHIGGDEVPERNYKKDTTVQKLIQDSIIQSASDADHYILERVSKHIKDRGRIPIGWDEARKVVSKYGGATMVWRDEKYAVEVLKSGGNIILTPSSHMYFDYYQKTPVEEPLAIGGYLPVEIVHGYTPPKEHSGKILGIQANLWTEYIATEDYAKYMLFPRLYALSEVAWGTNKNTSDFLHKINKKSSHYKKDPS